MVVQLPASLTLATSVAASASLQQQLAQTSAPQAVIDASGLVELDSAAIAVLLACLRTLEQQGRRLRVVQPPAHLIELADLYGVDELLGLQAPAT